MPHRVAGNTGRVSEHLLAPDEVGTLTQVNDVLKEAQEDRESKALLYLHEAGAVREEFIQVVAGVPSVGEIAEFGWTKHGGTSGARLTSRAVIVTYCYPGFFTGPGRY